MKIRSIITTLVAAALVSACHGGSVVPPAESLGAQHVAPSLPAAAIAFQPLGPTNMGPGQSGKVNAYAQNPKNPNTIYVASGRGTGLETYSSAGIFRTTNGGKSWVALTDGLTDSSGMVSSVVNALWLDPSNPSVLLAATEYDGIFRSTNAGNSWKNVYATTQATQFVSSGSALYASTAAGILTSSDDGATWSVSLAGTSSRYPRAFGAVSGTSGGALYAGMSDGSVYSYANGTWSKAGTIPFNASTGTDGSQPDVHQIAVDPSTPTTVYASTNDGRWDQDLYASTDSGKTWTKVVPTYRGYNYYNLGLGTQSIAFSQVHAHLLYIGLDGGLGEIDADGSASPSFLPAATIRVIDLRNIWTVANGKDDRCWIASDQGLDDVPQCSTFARTPSDDVVTKTLATGLARHFLVSPNGKTIVVSLQDFDSHISYDGGKSWSDYFTYKSRHSYSFLYEDGFNELKPGDPSVCYGYDEASGLQVSNDGCHTYSSPSTQARSLLSSRLMTQPLAFDPKNPNMLYVVSGDIVGAGFPPAPKAVFLTTNGGQSFQKMPWPVSEPGMIVIDPHNPNHMLLGDLKNQKRSSLLVTFNGGHTWKTSKGVPVTAFWYSATISPVNGNDVLASSIDAKNNVFVLRSTNGGATFAKTATVVNAPLVRGRLDTDRRPAAPALRSFVADDGAEGTGHAAAFVYSPAREIRFNQNVRKGTPDAVLTTLRGAYLSTDLGQTWQRLDNKLIAHSFWGARWLGGYLYLASDGQGVLRSTTVVQR